MKHLLGSLSICCVLVLVSCESDLTTSGTNGTLQKKLILNPTHLEGVQFDRCTLKARVTNMPNSDVFFYWDIDEGQGFQLRDWIIYPTFYEHRAHTVRVKAYDSFTDQLLGYDSLRVDIRPPIAAIKMSPEIIDTAITSQLDGSIFLGVDFFVQTSAPLHLVDLVADFGEGGNEVTFTIGDGHISHLYRQKGTYQVIVRAYEKTGRYIGTDTSIVKVGLEPVTRSMLKAAKQVSAFLLIDSAHQVFSHPMFRNPLAVRIPFQNKVDSTHTAKADLTGTTLSAAYDYHYGGFEMLDSIAGAFNADFSMLEKLFVSVNDVRPTGLNKGTLVYRFEAKDLELLTVTSTTIIYITKTPRPTFLSQLQFESNVLNYPTGTFGVSGPPLNPTTVCAMIIFDR